MVYFGPMRYILMPLKVILTFLMIFLGILSIYIGKPIWGADRVRNFMYNRTRAIIFFILGVRIKGERFDHIEPGSLVMGNHRSYLDALLVPYHQWLNMVGRSDVRKWPIIGWAAHNLGAVWVTRESRHSRAQAKVQIVDALKSGRSIAVFPEGSSWEGPDVMPLRPGLFKEAAKSQIPIYLWALHVEDGRLAFPKGVNFMKHLLTFACLPKADIYVKIHKGGPLYFNTWQEGVNYATEWWNTTLRELEAEHPITHKGYWKDPRLDRYKRDGSIRMDAAGHVIN